MRPVILNYFFSPITILKGIGLKTAKLYSKLLCNNRISQDIDNPVPKIIDLLYHKPERILERIKYPELWSINNGDVVVIKVFVDEHFPPFKPTHPYKVRCHNNSGFINIVFFKSFPDYINKNFPLGAEVIVSGKVDRFKDELQMSHPDYILPLNNVNAINSIPYHEPLYPLTAGLTNKIVRSDIKEALGKIIDLPEWIDNDVMRITNWLSWKDSIIAMHNAKTTDDINLESQYIRRLAFDELLANQISIALIRDNVQTSTMKVSLPKSKNKLKKEFIDKLPFKLSQDQENALKEIETDIFSKKRMMRLLQGDVGSGKTVVAFLSSLPFIENKRQVAIMVPTSILANQHYEWLTNICKDTGIKIGILTGKIKGKAREKLLNELESGDIDILVGTHAIFQEHVNFKNLSYVIIDEQHRFGVSQRLTLIDKGDKTDVLVMTATPIPRTLSLTVYGDMDISFIKNKPKERKSIDTKIITTSKFDELVDRIRNKINENEKVYWICPLVEESETITLTAVNKRFNEFKDIFGEESVGLIHGKMKEDEKDKIMKKYSDKNGKMKILVATSVVEVGINVPDATIIIIEHPERFGLSQLHQLRGRVGRADKQSYCILFVGNISETALKRLNIIRESDDGFYIAEKDLKLRGAGEILGARQSGFAEYKIANLNYHYDLLCDAAVKARNIVKNKKNMPESLIILLYLFGYNEYIENFILN